jgi:hypothetical protein
LGTRQDPIDRGENPARRVETILRHARTGEDGEAVLQAHEDSEIPA